MIRTRSPVSHIDRTVGEAAEPDLRALQVGQDGHVAAGRFGRLANLAEPLAVIGMLTVAEVQPGHVHARIDERPGPLRRSVDGPSVQTIFARRVTASA